jgi:hypothetical protein
VTGDPKATRCVSVAGGDVSPRPLRLAAPTRRCGPSDSAYEERIELLTREARHRTPRIVPVIARQTATGGAQDFIGRFSEAIWALAANPGLLVRHEWQRIDVKDGHFADPIATRINFDGSKPLLNAAAARAIGFAIHECR